MEKSIAGRLKQIRKQKDLTQGALGEIIGVSKQAIANVENCHSNPSIDFISKLIENLDINSNWLITGRGFMFNSDTIQDDFTQKVEAILKNKGLI